MLVSGSLFSKQCNAWLIDWSFDWVSDRVIDWLIDWLIDWFWSMLQPSLQLSCCCVSPFRKPSDFVLGRGEQLRVRGKTAFRWRGNGSPPNHGCGCDIAAQYRRRRGPPHRIRQITQFRHLSLCRRDQSNYCSRRGHYAVRSTKFSERSDGQPIFLVKIPTPKGNLARTLNTRLSCISTVCFLAAGIADCIFICKVSAFPATNGWLKSSAAVWRSRRCTWRSTRRERASFLASTATVPGRDSKCAARTTTEMWPISWKRNRYGTHLITFLLPGMFFSPSVVFLFLLPWIFQFLIPCSIPCSLFNSLFLVRVSFCVLCSAHLSGRSDGVVHSNPWIGPVVLGTDRSSGVNGRSAVVLVIPVFLLTIFYRVS